MLRKLVLGLALAMSTALPLANVAEAAVGDGVVASRGASQLLPIEHVQYVYGGQNYCWYGNGWRGPDIIIADTPSAPASAGAAASAGTTGAAAAGAAVAPVGTAAVGRRWRRLAWRWRRLAWRRWRLARRRRRFSRRRRRLSWRRCSPRWWWWWSSTLSRRTWHDKTFGGRRLTPAAVSYTIQGNMRGARCASTAEDSFGQGH